MVLLIRVIYYFGNLLSSAMIARALLSWFVRGRRSGIVGTIYEFLYKITEPIVAPCRKLMNKYFNTGMLDFSIFVAMILVELVTKLIIRLLVMLV